MSPIDHELRTALQSRAHELSPSPDVLAGVERRARRMRRNRAAAAVAGSALAISAIAVVVPGLASSTRTDPGPMATSAPTSAPVVGRPANALDWPSTPLDPTAQGHGAFLDEYAVTRGRDDRPQGEVLWSGEAPGMSRVTVFQLWYPGEAARTVVGQESESGPFFVRDTDAQPDQPVVDAVAQGGELPFVVTVHQPGTSQVLYAPDGVAFEPVDTGERAAVFPRTGPTDVQRRDEIRLLDGDGRQTFQGPVYLGAAEGEEGGPESVVDYDPGNLLATWPQRGIAPADLRLAAQRAFSREMGLAGALVQDRVLFGGDDDAGNRYLIAQAWLVGGKAHTIAYQERPAGEPVFWLGPATSPDTPVVAMLVQRAPGQDDDVLVVVPQPRTGQVLYREAGGTARPVENAPGLDGVVLVDRSPGTEGDGLLLLDGNGDLDNPTFDGPVANLLCGLRSTSC